MPADAPTILATSGGFREGQRSRWEFSELTEYAIELAGVTGRAPRMCFVATALGDDPTVLHWLIDAAQSRGLRASHLTLFPMPNVGGTTDSFGPELRPVTDGLALVPYSNGVHYDSEEQRRPLFRRLIGDGTLPPGYATDDGAGILYRGTDFVEAVSERAGAAAHFVDADEETRLDTRRLY
jgi:hypothetical protein